MACICANLLTEGIDVLCENNSGGVLEILVADACQIVGFTETVDGIVDSITMETGAQFYPIETQRLTASFEENETNNFDNGSKFYDQILNIVVARRDVARRNAIAGLGAGQKDLVFIVRDSNSTWWEQGLSEGMKLLTSTGGSGVKKEDLNGYTIQFSGQSSDLMSTVDDAIISALLIPAP
jgi:hypothetical protein